jgi:hypothetical protein
MHGPVSINCAPRLQVQYNQRHGADPYLASPRNPVYGSGCIDLEE